MRSKQFELIIACMCTLVLFAGDKSIGGGETPEEKTNSAAKEVYDNDAKLRLQPAYGLWKRYDPNSAKYAFRAKSVKEARLWQKKVRSALNKVLGFQDEAKVDPQPRLLEKVNKGDYTREKVLIRTTAYTEMPVYILLPKGAPRPVPVVIALHGHGYGVKDIVGIRKDGSERDEPEGYQKDFAVALCRRGFAVAAPEISCFGERQTDFSYLNKELGQGAPKTCAHTAALASHLGGSALGLRVLDTKRLVDYLYSREQMDVSRLGMMGISGGGMLTFFATALDKRVKACVISGYFCTFRDSIFAMGHCSCNYVPGLSRFGDMSDIVGLIAPRPMLVEAGSLDPIFPIESVKASVRRAKEVYKVFGAESQTETDYFEGKHQISGRRAYDFLMEKLGK
ncbi:MAG TPA: alpha/beta hydrolase family protein [Sedimentisphaerales bacterium]|nr:alpha/beta hydrolase family protein [Sedimentisphaerales bacterium]